VGAVVVDSTIRYFLFSWLCIKVAPHGTIERAGHGTPLSQAGGTTGVSATNAWDTHRDMSSAIGMAFMAKLTGPANLGTVALAKRICGEIRRDCLDHVAVFGEQHLQHLLSSYRKYYNEARTHLSVSKDAPIPRAIQAHGRTCAIPILGGLHHQYFRV
jgi:hypothetical protein